MGSPTNLEEEWDLFLTSSDGIISYDNKEKKTDKFITEKEIINNISELNISTKTKIAYLNANNVDILHLFWSIGVLEYNERKNGIIKKQIKISIPIDEKDALIQKVEQKTTNESLIINITNIKEIKKKFICKLNIGLSKKDLLNKKNNSKGAFYNCFMIVLRIFYQGVYKEINAKIFNTGKMSFPGMISDELLEITINTLLESLNYKNNNKYTIVKNTINTVLVNSNFNCGFYINRDKLADILKTKYNIHVYYDSCSYPGIQCKYKIDEKNTMSFMIFRTGSILIVGKCSDKILYEIYEFIKSIIVTEYKNIYCYNEEKMKDPVVKKRKKRIIYISK